MQRMDLSGLERPGDYVDGAFRVAAQPDGELHIVSPADDRDLTALHPWARSALQTALAAARRAVPAWRRTSLADRATLLRGYQARLRAHSDALAEIIAREVGKPLWEAKTEVAAMIAKVDIALGEALHITADVELADLPGEIRHRPLGVIAVIGPFNFPGHLPNGQIVPALLLGNCVVHKPSEKTPSAATWIARCIHEAGFPAGVFNVVQGPGSLGGELASHPEVDGVMFTGSSAVGRRIVASQGARLDRLIALELGGKNASVALDDCDLERTARAVAFAAYVTAGQRCTATSRLIVTHGMAERLVARVAEIARGLQVGHPLAELPVFMGPIISAQARERLFAAQAKARAHGFEAIVEGGPVELAERSGNYLRPALHLARDPDNELPGYSDTELFAPDLAVYIARDLDHAIDLANRSTSGLTASVFSASRAAFEHAADNLRVGVLQWNRASAGASSRLPFGGIRDSGNHRPAGAYAGTSCSYPLAVQLPGPADAKLPSWPGSGLQQAST
jgi:succinylglutamic semialdehyde dehydrogenase